MRSSCFFICLLLFFFFLRGSCVQAQEEKIYKGVVVDSLEKTPLEKSTISLLFKKEVSSTYSTDEKGRFSFAMKSDSAVLLIRYLGYTEKKIILLRSKINDGRDTIYLAAADKRMEDIVVKAKVPPVVVRGDTTEFNIDSAMFEPFDVVEDLVRRLPGLEIDAEGRMSFHGKPINRILVDGEDLFNGDPTFSMKKLPAGMVAKIQVMDTRSLEQLFSGTPSDGEEKTLNIKLKAGNKSFGSGDVMVGSKNQLGANGTASQFNGSKRISLTGSLASSNEVGISKIRKGPSSSFSNIGGSYNNKWGKLRLNGSYSYNQNGNENNMYRERTQVITADTSIFSRTSSRSNFNSNGQRFALGLNWYIDSSSTLDVNLAYSTSKSNGQNSSASATSENGSLRSESINNSLSAGKSAGLTGTLFWSKLLNSKGRSFSVNARLNESDQDNKQLSQSTNTYFKTGLPVTGDTLDRHNINRNNTRNYGVNLSYFEPISKYLRFNLRSDLEFNRTNTKREVYNLDSITKSAEFDSLYSAAIYSSSNTQNINASLVYNKEGKWNVNAGLTTVFQQAIRTLEKEELRQDLLRYSPFINASYFLAKGKTLRANFSAGTMQQTIEQLQPVPDNSNPLYVRLGNPNLKTSFSQNYSVGYSYAKDENSFSSNLVYSPISNQIMNAVFYDEYRRQTSKHINVNGIYTLRSNVSVTKTLRKDKQSKSWNAGSGFGYGQQVFFQSNNQYYSRNYTTNLNLSFNKREMAVRSARYTIGLTTSFNRNWTPADTKILNTTRLNIAPSIDGGCTLFGFIYTSATYRFWYNKLDYHSSVRRNDEYSMHNVNSEFRFQIQKKYWVLTTLLYQYNTRVIEGTPKATINCNLSANAQVMKGRGQLVFTAVDLFARTNNLRRTVGENFIEDVQVENLQNYFTLRFQFSFSKLEKRESSGRPIR